VVRLPLTAVGSFALLASVLLFGGCSGSLRRHVPPPSSGIPGPSQSSLDEAVEHLASELERVGPMPAQLRLAVLDMEDLTGATLVLGRYLSERLTTRLWTPGGASVIERRRLAQVLDELEFAQSDLVDPTNGRRFGRMAGVSAVVVGTVSVLSDRVEIDARIVDLETTRIVAAARTALAKKADVRAMLVPLPDVQRRWPGQRPAVNAAADTAGAPSVTQGGAVVWSDRSLRAEAIEARRTGEAIRVTFRLTNLTGTYQTVRFFRLYPELRPTGSVRTYLIDDSGNRYPVVEGSMFQRPYDDGVVELAPGGSVEAYLVFSPVARAAQSVTLVNVHVLRAMRLGPIPIFEGSS
jgi:TolB-like protein